MWIFTEDSLPTQTLRTALDQITKVWWYSVENDKNISALFYLASDLNFTAFWYKKIEKKIN